MDLVWNSIERSLGMSEGEHASGEVYEEERDALLRRASDAIKAVQREYAGKTTIATDKDSQVTCLCAQLEAILCHGLKTSRKRNVEFTYWPFVRAFLPQSEVKEIELLSNITTNSGRGRAWLRSALNDQTLKPYLDKFAQQPDVARNFYEGHAFVLDEEKLNMLAMLLQGLETHFMLELDTATIDAPRMTPSSTAASKQKKHQQEQAQLDTTPAAQDPPSFSSSTTAVAPTVVLKTKKKKKKKKSKKAKASEDSSAVTTATATPEPAATAPQPPQQADPTTSQEPIAQHDDIFAGQDEFLPGDNEPVRKSTTPDLSGLSLEEIMKQQTTSSVAADTPTPTAAATTAAEDGNPGDGDASTAQDNHGTRRDGDSTAMVGSPPFQTAATTTTHDNHQHEQHQYGEGDGGEETAQAQDTGADSSNNNKANELRQEAGATSPPGLGANGGVAPNADEVAQLRGTIVTVMQAKEELEASNAALLRKLAEMEEKMDELERQRADERLAFELKQQLIDAESQSFSSARGYDDDYNGGGGGAVDEEDAVDHDDTHAHAGGEQGRGRDARRSREDQADAGAGARDDDDDNADDDNDDDEDGDLGGYESIEQMQLMHEKTVLQLTQMHSELLEFNEHLQQQLREREKQVVQLGGQVPEQSPRFIPSSAHPSSSSLALSSSATVTQSTTTMTTTTATRPTRALSDKEKERVRVPAGIGIQIPGSNVQIHLWMPSARVRGKGSSSYYVYQICVKVCNEKWNVFRRYTHFYDLHRQVQHIFPEANLRLPQKKSLVRKGPKFIEQRRLGLEQYMRDVVSLCVTQPRSPLLKDPSKRSLCEALPFLKERMGRKSNRNSETSYSGL
ncbi:hypothetical protein PTSG_08550 [Salpingoeca rosetta]|uniref:PX domain-containing protein n=1 Tax=Salpingoeca rosetta (strain ATCC 50818 / BSB-021) TaxID=946362 RepID=F2UK06_SALR5|nr:uncharacterized protein PTSG_08550 [Salpingoeca rosetta]EGD77455.1 hypothetical protein PTSG_08550 [Salpingoeca rosetta]|eukprot:XP_004990343.1 hypothetical protein PTSG_08550 [Salpingoeca rosetta]